MGDPDNASAPAGRIDLSFADQVLSAVEQGIADGRTALRPLAAAVRIEMAVAAAEDGDHADPAAVSEPLPRIRSRPWAVPDDDDGGTPAAILDASRAAYNRMMAARRLDHR